MEKTPIVYILPCHRVLRGSGDVGGHRWETVREKAMLAPEFTAAGGAV